MFTSMTLIPLIFLAVGALLLVIGFKKNNRTLLVIAACMWLAHGTWGEVSQGFKDGVNGHSLSSAQ